MSYKFLQNVSIECFYSQPKYDYLMLDEAKMCSNFQLLSEIVLFLKFDLVFSKKQLIYLTSSVNKNSILHDNIMCSNTNTNAFKTICCISK